LNAPPRFDPVPLYTIRPRSFIVFDSHECGIAEWRAGDCGEGGLLSTHALFDRSQPLELGAHLIDAPRENQAAIASAMVKRSGVVAAALDIGQSRVARCLVVALRVGSERRVAKWWSAEPSGLGEALEQAGRWMGCCGGPGLLDRQPAVDQLQRRTPGIGGEADSHEKLQ
jgi:hypothetical protein